ncbi:MAG: hypothetical protein BMS9Abin07_1977 [Acidimicrobiia bacterium]|nr:MAG: hypothetical protein BMS9Abin07_1977 [Acidimicrobiia bacterium]
MNEDHNEYQRSYYTGRPLPRMTTDLAGTPYVLRHVEEVMSRLDLPPGASVLDVGCGLGKYTVALAELGIDVEGIDLTPKLIEELHARRPDIPVHLGDAAAPPSELAERFDAAIGFFFLHHVGDLAPIISGMRTTLKPGGRIAFLEPNPFFPGYYVQIALTPGMTWRGERGILQMRPAVVAPAAAAAGMQLVEHTAFGAVPPALANRAWGRALERGAEMLPGWDRVGAFQLMILE